MTTLVLEVSNQITLDVSASDSTVIDLVTDPNAHFLASLNDVNITSVADDQLLQYDAGTDKWINATVASASGDLWSDPVNANIIPDADGTRNLGTNGIRFAGVYTDVLAVTGNITVGGTVDGRDVDADGTKLDGVEALADVTDATNVNAAGAVMEVDYNANTILAATTDDTPVTLTILEQTIVGRITAGNIDALTVTEVRTLINVEDGAQVNPTTEEIQDDAWGGTTLSGTQTGIAVTYQDVTNDVDFVVGGLTTTEFASANVSQWTNDSGYITSITGGDLGDLSDVTITTVGTGELIKWSGSAWINNTLSEAGIQPLDATLTSLAAYNTNGVLTQTAADTFVGRTITAGDAKISITNGDGVAGNPTVDFGSVAVADLSDGASMGTQASSSVSITGGSITGMSSPSVNSDVATKEYVDTLSAGLSWKEPALVKTTGDITLSGEQTIDGVPTSASRVLVASQGTGSENGIYVSDASTWSRSADADTGAELVSAAIFIVQGTANADKAFVCTNDSITIGATAITFVNFGASIGALLVANNLSDLASATTALTNLGFTASITELNYTNGVTSAIQTQFGNKQPLDAGLTDISGLAVTDSNFIVGNGANWVAESGATARASLGLGTLATQSGTFSGTSSGTNTGDQTNITGNAATVTTNANSTGAITSIGNATSLGSFTSAQLATALTDETGSGSAVFGTSPTLVTPALGTPSALVGTNVTGTATSLTSGITNALKSATTTVNVSSATAPSVGYVLTATSSTTATWQAAAGGGDLWGDPVDAVITPDADGTRDLATTGTRFATGYFDNLTVTTAVTSTTFNKITVTTPATGGTLTIVEGATLTASATATVSGTNTGDQTNITGNAATVTTNANLTGPVTSIGNATTITADSVTYDIMQDTSATDVLLGRSTAGAGTVEEVACTSAGRALIDDADAAAQRVTIGLATQQSSFFQSVAADDTIVLVSYALYACTIEKLWNLKTSSGTCTLAIQINGTPVTSLTGLSVTSTPQSPTATAANTVAIGDRLTVVITSSSTPLDLEFTLESTI